jgi:hypothetical protein
MCHTFNFVSTLFLDDPTDVFAGTCTSRTRGSKTKPRKSSAACRAASAPASPTSAAKAHSSCGAGAATRTKTTALPTAPWVPAKRSTASASVAVSQPPQNVRAGVRGPSMRRWLSGVLSGQPPAEWSRALGNKVTRGRVEQWLGASLLSCLSPTGSTEQTSQTSNSSSLVERRPA